jgi:hypothetical protein
MTVEEEAAGRGALGATLDEPVDRMALLRAGLDAWAEPTDDVAPTRENIRRLLEILKRHLGDVLDPQEPMEDGSTLVTPHWASSLLETMIDGLVDLDRGLAPKLLKRAPPGLGNAKTTQENKLDYYIVQAVKIVRQANTDKNYNGALLLGENQSAEDFVARKIKANGGLGTGQTYSEAQLKNLPGAIRKRMRLPKNLLPSS